ncbi:hypothetical protein BKK79_07695 [Cupriavidus sp. USMAA2-4]|uniref:Uncharacterized protein n=1 Tax=Cupriavidus malaysiensis TaxID=367825 RepID=A0ABM6F1E5_9BURK|nr:MULTISPECIES: hypothetical protein [Cupriavidus]AOY91693.1 hypothetical protein BKK79_07695 [Cupriavidus sp. USMAA2-4]AOY98749.1 hypothetical protein BKK81_05225 [Cupriavidus sp. USMAHM13]AOZ05182.1 hypothetical protein BKK80_04575 [Cupriavidus malaysiensis]
MKHRRQQQQQHGRQKQIVSRLGSALIAFGLAYSAAGMQLKREGSMLAGLAVLACGWQIRRLGD